MNNPFQSYNRGYTARERRIRRDYGMLFAATGIICIWLAIKVSNQERHIRKMEDLNITLTDSVTKLNSRIDTLYDDSFNTSTVNGRYELSLEHLKEVNPKAAQEFVNFMNTQTE